MKTKRPLRLYCFSPPVMVATFIIELVAAIYVLYRYKLSPVSRTIAAMLLFLGGFQLAEYFVCTHSSIAVTASRLGFVAITFLPPLGFYLMSLFAKKKNRKLIAGIFALTGAVAAYFLLAPRAISAYECTGNYVIFQIGQWQAYAYGLYYFGLIGWTIVMGIRYLRSSPKAKASAAVKWLLAGYAFFMVPVAVLTVTHPDTSRAIPSILCGFAITMALVLAICVAPLSLKKR